MAMVQECSGGSARATWTTCTSAALPAQHHLHPHRRVPAAVSREHARELGTQGLDVPQRPGFLLVLAAGLGQLLHVQERERVLSRQPSTGIGISSQFHPAARSSALFFSRGGREGGEEAPCSIASSMSSSTKTPRSTGRPRRRCSSGSCSSWMVEPAMCRRPRSLARSLACLLGSNSATMLTTRPTSCCSTTCLGPGSLKLATTVVLEIPGANLGQEGAHGGAHAVRAALMMQPRPERASEPGGGGGGCGPRTGRRPTD